MDPDNGTGPASEEPQAEVIDHVSVEVSVDESTEQLPQLQTATLNNIGTVQLKTEQAQKSSTIPSAFTSVTTFSFASTSPFAFLTLTTVASTFSVPLLHIGTEIHDLHERHNVLYAVRLERERLISLAPKGVLTSYSELLSWWIYDGGRAENGVGLSNSITGNDVTEELGLWRHIRAQRRRRIWRCVREREGMPLRWRDWRGRHD